MSNLLLNGSFENGSNGHSAYVYTPNGAYVTTRGEINTPRDWNVYYKHDQDFVPPWDPQNTDGWCEPEVVIIPNATPYLNPPRVADGNAALKLFTTYRINHTGVFQCVPTTPGHALRLSALVHAWSSVDDDPYQSTGHGTGAVYAPEGAYGSDYGKGNFVFRVGIDPTGGTDPFAASVVWGVGCHVYNAYAALPPVIAVAEGNYVTVFVESFCHLRFKHNDAYFDNVVLEDVSAGGGDGRGAPREQYEKITLLMHPNATNAQWLEAANVAWFADVTLSGNRDDAGVGDLDARRVLAMQFDEGPQFDMAELVAWFAQHYPGVSVAAYPASGDSDDDGSWGDGDITPFEPVRYILSGTALGLHCAGSYPLDRVQALAAAGVVLPSVKFVQSIGDLAQAAEPYRLARVIDWPGLGNLEGFNYNGNPEAQAEARMAALMPIFTPYKARLGWLEILNEQDCSTPAQAVLLARFYLRAMQIAEDNGFKLALFSLPLGCPEQDEWEAMVDTGVFEAAAAGGHAISLHEYGDATSGPNSIIARYRGLYENIILSMHMDIPLFITEYNVTRDMLSSCDLIQQWAAYDALVRQDPYVAGVHLYSLGMIGDEYVDYVSDALGEFVDYAISQKDVVNS